MTLRMATGGLIATLLMTVAAPAVAIDILAAPPAHFKKVSTLVKLPSFVPGLGTLYVDPKTLPLGPFLGYDHRGKLVNVTYMVPLAKIDAHETWADLGKGLPPLSINHTDVAFNPGHPGVEEPHYHISQWLISHKDEQARMAK